MNAYFCPLVAGLLLVLSPTSNALQSNALLPTRQVARAADANRDGKVSTQEWQTLIQMLDPESSGSVDSQALLVRICLPMIERLEDGVLDLDDLFQVFIELDGNKDDLLDARELAPRMFGGLNRNRPGATGGSSLAMAVLSLRVADENKDGLVDPDEWGLFVDSIELESDGSIGDGVVSAWLSNELSIAFDPKLFNAASLLKWIHKGIDSDGDGRSDVALMRSLFEQLDRDANGALDLGEMALRSGSRGGSAAQRNRNKPGLMPWQRNLKDAWALVQSSGKPLLICVNMDGEFASESFAWSRYRNSAFVSLVDGFIPLLFSPNRHNPRDHDDRGRRITDQRFGRLVNGEHLFVEKQLLAAYFNGTRTAPRHIGVSAKGEVLFDIFLENDLSLVDRALEKHGRLELGSSVAGIEMSDEELLRSPDAGHRDVLESRFLLGDELVRVRLAGLSLSAVRTTQHPEMLRLALMDTSKPVRSQAVWNMAQHPGHAPLDFFALAFDACAGDARAGDALFAALETRVRGSDVDPSRYAAQELRRALAGFRLPSPVIELARWRTALSWSAAAGTPQAHGANTLVDELSAASRALSEHPKDSELNLAFAAACVASARSIMTSERDARLLFEDARVAGQRAASAAPEDGRGLAYAALAQDYLGDGKAAVQLAALALGKLVPWAGSPLAANMLNLLAAGRMQAVRVAKAAKDAWPESWIADVRAAHELLLTHSYGHAEQATDYVLFLNELGLRGPQEGVLQRAIGQFPASESLHSSLRDQVLRDGSAKDLELVYDTLVMPETHAQERDWYTALAWLRAAERHVENRSSAEAKLAYIESSRRFQSALDIKGKFSSSAGHFICLSLAGLARLQTEEQLYSKALQSLRRGVAANQESVWKSDGLGHTPRETAQLLHKALLAQSMAMEAQGLVNFLAEKGLEIGT